jgi:pto-interacting protein 1
VLLFQGFRAKIADYDLFKQLPQEQEAPNAVKLSWYQPPEYVPRLAVLNLFTINYVCYYVINTCCRYMMTGCRSSPKFDVYSYGVVLLELLTGRKRFKSWSATPDLLEWVIV